MPRKAAVSDDQLREAIGAIVDQGESPTVKRVWGYLRARPGQYASGSNTVTISRVLREWRQGITQLPAPTAAKSSAEGEESARKVTALADRLRHGLTKILKADRAATGTRLEALTDQVAELTARLEVEKAARAQAEERARQLAEELAKLKAATPTQGPSDASDDTDITRLVSLLKAREDAADEGRPYVATAPSGWFVNDHGNISSSRSARVANLAIEKGLVVSGPGVRPGQRLLYTPGYYAKISK